MSSNLNDTIVAPATPEGMSALSVIRISGKDAIRCCATVFKGPDLQKAKSHTIHYGHLMDGAEEIDEVMVSVFRAPRSFTTEDSIEISSHGSAYIQRRIIHVLQENGARMAEPGEFTMRAYLNGRIDLAQAEAVASTIQAQNEAQLSIALRQMRGELSRKLQELRAGLLDFVSLIELELDFGEEDVEFADRESLKSKTREILEEIRPLTDSFRYGNAIKNGIPVVIIGRPNAGKSSLLNMLLNEERAIVSEIAGTTRDTIEEEIHIQGVGFRFIDTAGIRSTEDTIEKIGIERALKKAGEAEMILYIYDVSAILPGEVEADLTLIRSVNGSAGILIIGNKVDLLEHAGSFPKQEKEILMSLKKQDTGEIENLKRSLWDLSGMEHARGSAIVSNERHYRSLTEATGALEEALVLMEGRVSSDILSLELRRAMQAIGEITGIVSSDEVLGNIFGRFCIGK